MCVSNRWIGWVWVEVYTWGYFYIKENQLGRSILFQTLIVKVLWMVCMLFFYNWSSAKCRSRMSHRYSLNSNILSAFDEQLALKASTQGLQGVVFFTSVQGVEKQSCHGNSASVGFFVGIVFICCRECLSLGVQWNSLVPCRKWLGYCACSKNSNSETGLAHE